MFSFFRRKKKQEQEEIDETLIRPLKADMHSHLLPGLDDGASDVIESLQMLEQLQAQGYEKFIMTPHILSDYYKNTPETIGAALQQLREAAQAAGLDISLEAAAEYYLDEGLADMLHKRTPLLSFGKDRYVLFETSFMNASQLFDEVVFQMQSQGYQPVLAHPERYAYLYEQYDKLREYHERGILLQVNLGSLLGIYSEQAKKIAERLIDEGLVSFLGTDCHNTRHADRLLHLQDNYHYKKALTLPLRNHEL